MPVLAIIDVAQMYSDARSLRPVQKRLHDLKTAAPSMHLSPTKLDCSDSGFPVWRWGLKYKLALFICVHASHCCLFLTDF